MTLCKHGQSARQCETCWCEAELAEVLEEWRADRERRSLVTLVLLGAVVALAVGLAL